MNDFDFYVEARNGKEKLAISEFLSRLTGYESCQSSNMKWPYVVCRKREKTIDAYSDPEYGIPVLRYEDLFTEAE